MERREQRARKHMRRAVTLVLWTHSASVRSYPCRVLMGTFFFWCSFGPSKTRSFLSSAGQSAQTLLLPLTVAAISFPSLSLSLSLSTPKTQSPSTLLLSSSPHDPLELRNVGADKQARHTPPVHLSKVSKPRISLWSRCTLPTVIDGAMERGSEGGAGNDVVTSASLL